MALNKRRSNGDSLSEEIVPATKPSWTDFGSESGTADSSNGAPISRDGSEPEFGLVIEFEGRMHWRYCNYYGIVWQK